MHFIGLCSTEVLNNAEAYFFIAISKRKRATVASLPPLKLTNNDSYLQLILGYL